jgi:hypothetical protein
MEQILDYIKQSAILQRNKALLSLTLLYNKSVGIGDHSTNDYYKNIDEAFDMFCDAEDKLEHIKKLKKILKD